MNNKRIFCAILLLCSISFSHAYVPNHHENNDTNYRIENIDEQISLISNKLTVPDTNLAEVEMLEKLKEDLIAEKVLLENGIEFYNALEEKLLIFCPPPPIFKRSSNQQGTK
ncbi:hypothetical protein N8878_07245 [Psychromonas sp.]|nr:hypothetical protein [Psychromonas sp.]